ncbi:transcriptional regulator [Brachybacterium endophyticum]|uniref:Transcriptional regulator n=1 Tax=Brachybacterium endophyticum TaxID=2182385 RepID=A0A2U2RIA3_9MICO|nr:helix-turn-helix transcriptional regulator [Brachybacterium endophyticum]PWH05495.1 transcriptional regulator [Brachybacterium endophyticum]
MDREALAAFLVSRRHRISPADVGLPLGARRRTPGLRREEVAQLAAMSVDYLSRLEQRRGPQPSSEMLVALARALRLTADERDYLFHVAGHSAPDRLAVADHVSPALLRVLDRLSDTPAMILSALDEPLVQNDAARALFGDASQLTGWERSGIYRWFASPETTRGIYPPEHHAQRSRALAATLRAAYGSMGPRSRAGALARELAGISEEFRELWDAHVVAQRFEDHEVLVHPEVGEIEVDCQALFTEDASQVLLVITAPPRTGAAQKLELVAVLGTQTAS